MKTGAVIILLMVLLAGAQADILLQPGDTYTLDINDIDNWVIWASPDYPVFNDYSFTIGFINDLYDSAADDLRIRLYEDPEDSDPQVTLFEPYTLAVNLYTSPNHISQFQAPGNLWQDFTGRLEVEVLSGSLELDYVRIQLGPGTVSHTGSIDAIPEPVSLGLVAMGLGLLYRCRRNR